MSPGADRFESLSQLALIGISGTDARAFLQGQLSSDLRKLHSQQALLTSCSSAQGRVQAIMTLVETADGVFAIVPTGIVDRLLPRLRRYVLRAKVTVTPRADHAVVFCNAGQAAEFCDGLPPSAGACSVRGAQTLLRWWDTQDRYLLVTPRTALEAATSASCDEHWRRADIMAGLPQVYPETCESFVAQMLNLDLLGGISFDKGCYTGQEIIARTQYRGTIRRRMLRFTAPCAPPLPGTRVLRAGQHAGEVVAACNGSDSHGHCELLAVVALDQADEPLELDAVTNGRLTRTTLPYLIPESEAA